MIHGENQMATTALDFIRQSSIDFTLTGSRYFGNFTEKSDWDFFADYSEDTAKKLLVNGFELEHESYQGDPVIVQVYKRENVHVQLVTNSRHKRYVQRCLCPVFRSLDLNKEQQKLLWSIAIRLYRGGNAESQDVVRRLAKK